MNITAAAQLLVFVLGAGWTVVFYLLKRTLASIDKKIDESLQRSEQNGKELHAALASKEERLNRNMRILATAGAKQMQRLRGDMDRRNSALKDGVREAMAVRRKACGVAYVSRQEFGAFTAEMNHKIDSIYEILKQGERTQKQ